jgi:hypothetical protein
MRCGMLGHLRRSRLSVVSSQHVARRVGEREGRSEERSWSCCGWS